MSRAVTYLDPEGTVPPQGRYSTVAITAPGRLAFVAGQVPVDDQGRVIAPGDLAAQIPVVFDNLGRILKSLGVGFDAVLEYTSYVTGDDARQAWYAARDDVYDRIYPNGGYPPNTLLIISGLAKPEFRVEISAIVRLPD
ncbi:MAG: RidA family protein [Pseudomonadota bacterium]